jgi:ParB/RepB/Spo0J family partition protein
MSNTQTIQPAAVAAEQAIQALHIPVALIDRDPAQPRTHFDEAALADLAESIRAHGVIQPIEVEATGDGRYRLHHGERRWRASKLAGRETIPAVVAPPRAADERLVRQALENLHREDLNPIDEARVYQGLIDHGWARLRIARETGKSLPLINGRLAWLKLEPEVQRLVALGHLSKDGRLAEKLYVLPPEARVPLAGKLARHGLGLQASLRACDKAAEEIARKAEALEEGRQRHTDRAASVPAANGALGTGDPPGRNGTLAHAVPLVAYGAGGRRAVTATIGEAAEAMCRGCAVRPAGADIIPAWEIVERAAAETCAACVRRDGPPIPRVCELCQGAVLLGRLLGAVKAQETAA